MFIDCGFCCCFLLLKGKNNLNKYLVLIDTMDISLNIVDLIENNPIVKLSPEYNNRLINKIKEIFTESQQHIFVSSFYCYLYIEYYHIFIQIQFLL